MDPHSFAPPHIKAHKHYILHRPEVSPAPTWTVTAFIGRLVLFTYNIEIFDILLVRFNRNTFELYDFHE